MRAIVGHLENIRDHPNANNLHIADFVTPSMRVELVVGKHYVNGQRGFYIPEGEEVPDDVAEEMWLKGKLSGPKKNVVKRKTMRGVVSIGLFYGEMGKHWDDEWQEGQLLRLEDDR